MNYRPPLYWRAAPGVWWRWHCWEVALVAALAVAFGPVVVFGLWVLAVTVVARARAGW